MLHFSSNVHFLHGNVIIHTTGNNTFFTVNLVQNYFFLANIHLEPIKEKLRGARFLSDKKVKEFSYCMIHTYVIFLFMEKEKEKENSLRTVW